MKTFNRKTVFFSACLAILIFGIMMTALGSILPSITAKFSMTTLNAGSLFLLMTFGMLIGSIIFGPVVDRFGYKALLIVCSAAIALGLEGMAYAPSLLLFRISVFVTGLGGGVINGGANALVADIAVEDKGSDLSFLGIFFGFGAFGVPFVMGILLGFFSFESLLAIIGALVLIPFAVFFAVSFPSPKIQQGFPLRRGVLLLKDRALTTLGIILFFESGMEITTCGWASTFLYQEFNAGEGLATLILSFFWLGLITARLILIKLLKSVSPVWVMAASIGVAFTGSLMMAGAGNIVTASIGLVFLGIGFAAVFPVILGFVGNMYPELSGTAFSIVLAMALTGGMILPWLTGVIGNYFGMRISFLVVTFSLIAVAILFSAYKLKLMPRFSSDDK
ncbi:hypothetical protein ES708_05996 [subsurface metagenome]